MNLQEGSPEFSRPLQLRAIEADGMHRAIEATAAERAGLARRFGLLGIEELRADLTIRRLRERGVIAVQGEFSARVVQECVVTLDPIESRIEQAVDERLTPVESAEERIILAAEEEDFEEPVQGDTLDLGEIVAQCLSLALDPYPRKEGAALDLQDREGDPSKHDGPFAALANLKRGST